MADKKNQWVIIDGARYNLASMKNLGINDSRWGTGLSLEAIYLMPRSKKVIVETYSIWENGRGECTGTKYHIADEWEIAELAKIFGGDLIELIPVAEDK